MSTSYVAPHVCIACGAAPRERFRLRNGAPLRQCPRCLLGWWDWPPFEPAEFYDASYFQATGDPKGYDDYAMLEPGVARTAAARLRRIERLLPCGRGDRGRMFEIGCGTGVFLGQARRAGWDVAGLEVSAYAAEVARRRGLEVRACAVETLEFEPGTYDCVALWDVIEHLRDPVTVLQAAGRMLRRGGLLALSTGDIASLCARLSGPGWHLFNVPEHLFFFSFAALRRLAARAACRVSSVTREVNWVPVAYVRERLHKAHGWPWPRLRRGSKWVVPATLGDVLGVYAVRC